MAVDVVIKNDGGSAATPLTVTFTGPFSGTGCAASLAAGTSCTEKVTFTPTAAGPVTGTMSVAAGTASVSVMLQGNGTKGALAFTPSVADLTGVAIGATKAGFVTLTNSGTGAAAGLAVAVTGVDFAIDLATTTCKTSLDAGANCIVGYTFAPKSDGQKTGTITASATGTAAVTAVVSATVPKAAALVITPATAPLTANVGADSAAFTFTVANSGETATGNLKATISGTDAAAFKTTTSTCTSLEPRAYCTIAVVFNSATAGANKTAKLTVADATVSASADLVGTATTPSTLAITGGPALGTVEVGKTGTAVTFTVTNKGDTNSGALAVTTGSAEFAIAADKCTGKDLKATETCTVDIALAPASAGAKAALLTVKGSSTAANLTLTGTATAIVQAHLSVAPTTWDFGAVPTNQDSAAKTFTITNDGLATTANLTIAVTGAAAASFTATSTCNAPLAVNATCTATVVFKPALQGALAASLSITDGATSAPVALSGTGLAPSVISLSGAATTDTLVTDCSTVLASAGYLDVACNALTATVATPATAVGFAPVVVGDPNAVASSYIFTITNDHSTNGSETGALSPTISGDAAADYVIGTNTCTLSLLDSQSCTVEVKFAPKTVGVRSAIFTVTTEKGGKAVASLNAYARPLVDIAPIGNASTHPVTLPTAAVVGTGLAYADQSNGAGGEIFTFRVLRNGSTAATRLNNIAITLTSNGGGQSDDFRITSNDCTSLTGTVANNVVNLPSPAGDYCTVTVQFYPQTGVGVKSAILTATGANGGTASVTLTGNAVGPLKWTPVDAQHTGFGDVLVGGSSASPLTLTLTNSGGVDLGPVTLAIDSTQVGYVVDNCSGQTLTTSSRTCTVQLTLIPSAVGAVTGTLTATAGTQTAQYALTGNGITAPPITVSPAAPTFANTALTAKSDFVVFTVTNPAAVATREITYTVAGTIAGDFEKLDTDLGTCGVSGTTRLDPSASCTIKVRFAPVATAAVGKRTGTLTVGTTGQSNIVTNLSAIATSQIVVTPTSNAFAAVAVGQASAPVTFTVTNQGALAAAVTVAGTFANGGFALSSGTCNPATTTTVAAGGTCTFLASMTGALSTSTPAVGSTALADLTQATPAVIAGSVAVSGGTYSNQTITLSGSITNKALIQRFNFTGAVTDVEMGAVLAAGSTATPTATVTYQNVGKWPASTISAQWCPTSSYVATGTDACTATDPEFSVVTESSTCLSVSTLAPLATCTMTVRLLPAASAVASKWLNLKYNDGADTQNLVAFKFLGEGHTSTTPYISPANYTFSGTTAFGSNTTATFTFNNPAAGSYTPSAITAAAAVAPTTDFAVVAGGTCAVGTAVPVAGSCTIVVRFAPTVATGVVGRTGTVTVTDGSTTYVAGVTATATRPAHLVMTEPGPFMQRTVAGPSTYVYDDFGSAVVGRATPAFTFVVTNDGDVATGALTADIQVPNAAFQPSSGCAGALAAHTSCTVTVTAMPAAAGLIGASDVKLVVSDGGSLSVSSNALNVVGLTKAVLSRSPAVENFAAQAVKSPSCYTPVAITNGSGASYDATAPLVVSVSSADYEAVTTKPADAGSCTYSGTGCAAYEQGNLANTTNTGLPSGGTCNVWVRFVPQTLPSPATINGSLSVAGGTDAGTVTVSMTGTATSALSASVATLTTAGSITITNAVGAPTTGILSTTLGTPSNIVITANSCVGKMLTGVAGTNTCSITIAKAAAGAATGTLTVAGTPGNSAAITINIP